MNLKAAYSTIETILTGKINLMLLITNICNSKCTICNHWSQPDKKNLTVSVIEKLLQSKLVNKNGILLEGGEAILHPQIKEILWLLKRYNYTLLSNGLLPTVLSGLVTDFKIPNVSVSLDGTPSTYLRIRGVDGYDRVINTIQSLYNKTKLSVCYTICPDNTFEDYIHVERICKKYGVDLLLNIYCEMEYSGKHINKPIDRLYEYLPNAYVRKYNRWLMGGIKSNCFGIKNNCSILSNGDVVLCQARPVVFGNVYEQSIDDIWKNRKIYKCNDCWMSCNRYLEAKWV